MKKIFRFEDYNGRYVMNCKTIDEAKEFCKLMHKEGKKWCDGGLSYLEENNWGFYKEDTCYNFNYGYFSPRQYYNDKGYTILEWSDFTTDSSTLSKQELSSDEEIKMLKERLAYLSSIVFKLATNQDISNNEIQSIDNINSELWSDDLVDKFRY